MTDIGRARSFEGRISEHVIRMLVRVHDVEDRLVRSGANSRKEPSTNARAASGVDDRRAFVADHETNVRNAAFVCFSHQGDLASMSENAGRHFLNRERRERVGQRGTANDRQRQSEERAQMDACGCFNCRAFPRRGTRKNNKD
jgi:hypothetical protein